MQSSKLQEIQLLVRKLNEASDAYYNGRAEMMTDFEWNADLDRLKRLEIESGIVLPESPTNRVGADNTLGQKEEHEFAALSLAKTKSVIELAKWASGRPIWLSWKLDGLTLVVTYDSGRLTKVVTRGDGHIGTNITHLAKAIEGIRSEVSDTGHIVIRGEAVISYADFEQFNMEADEEYANPRNLASGSLTLKNANEAKTRHLQWIPFTLVHSDSEIRSWGERMEFLRRLGFNPVEHELIANPEPHNIEKVIEQWTERVTSIENRFPFPVDGLVINYDDTEYASTGSVTGHHATRAGYAFKWQDESAETQLERIEWSCAVSTISPIAVFRPVELEGTMVKRASLCNISECRRLGIGDSGTQIAVIKANKIIPKVIEVIRRKGDLHIPTTCPVCSAPTEIIRSEISSTETLHCTNKRCAAKQLKKFARFVSKEGMSIDGLSEQTLQKFVNLGWVLEYANIFNLSVHANEIRSIDGFGDRSVNNLLTAIEKARNAEARRLLYALNIPLVGKEVCMRLLSAYSLEELIIHARQASDPAIFSSIPGIGPEKSTSFVTWMQDAENIKILDNLLHELSVSQPVSELKGERCKGQTFAITGDVQRYKNRDELKAYIESQGGKVTGSVSKSTDFLINNDAESTSSKNQKAKALSIPIITEGEFIERFGE